MLSKHARMAMCRVPDEASGEFGEMVEELRHRASTLTLDGVEEVLAAAYADEEECEEPELRAIRATSILADAIDEVVVSQSSNPHLFHQPYSDSLDGVFVAAIAPDQDVSENPAYVLVAALHASGITEGMG